MLSHSFLFNLQVFLFSLQYLQVSDPHCPLECTAAECLGEASGKEVLLMFEESQSSESQPVVFCLS